MHTHVNAPNTALTFTCSGRGSFIPSRSFLFPLCPAHTPSAQCAHPLQWAQETESPNDIPPEAVQEYMDIMDQLLGPVCSASGEPGGERKEDTKEWHEEDDALSYLYQLCSEKDFVTEVGWLRAPGATRFQRVALQHPALSTARANGIELCSCFLS